MDLQTIPLPAPLSTSPRARVLVIYTGGTFGMVMDASGALVPLDFAHIVDHLPELSHLGMAITVVAFDEPIDSSNVSPEHWQVLGRIIFEQYASFDGFVILHGTDTMAYTASALSFMLEGLAKPVVLTGAQLPIYDPRSDARRNFLTALEIAADGRVPEVCLFFNDTLLRGNRARKVDSAGFDAFASANYPPLARAGIPITYDAAAIRTPPAKQLRLRTGFDPRVAVLSVFPGITPGVVQAALGIPDLQALVLETYGSGNAPTLAWLIDALRQARTRGVSIVNLSQCPRGRVVQGHYGASQPLAQMGVLSGADLTREAALTKLMFLLGEFGPEALHAQWSQSLAGELSES